MRLRLKLTLLLGLALLLAIAGLFIYDKTTQGVYAIVERDAGPSANLSVSTLALSVRGQEIFSALVDLESAIEEDNLPKALQLMGLIEIKELERQRLLNAVHPSSGDNSPLASLLREREQIVKQEHALLSSLLDGLSRAREKEARLSIIRAFMKGDYPRLERERRARAEAIANLALEKSQASFSRIEGALEQGHNLYLAIILTLLLSFVFVLFFINKKMIRPIEQITHTIEQISIGRLNAEVSDELKSSTDEIGRLAQAFDRTIMSLKMSMRAKKEPVEERRERGK